MREIRFRGKRVDNGEWAYGYYVYHKIHGRHDIWSVEDWDWYEVFQQTVGQFLGHKDVDGRTMCEGDILENEYKDRGEIKFGTDRFFWVHGIDWGEIEPGYSKPKIIGNIHDNLELLK